MEDLSLPAPNIPLLRKAVEWAAAEAQKPPEQREWNQGTWAEPTACGTAYCVAGYVAITAMPGAREVASTYGDYDLYVGDKRWRWDEAAQGLLGITGDEADDLFAAGNTITDVRRVAEEIAARAGERL